MELWATNDTPGEVDGVVAFRLRTFAGDTVWEENVHARLATNSSRTIRRWERDELEGGHPDHYLSARSSEGRFAPNRHFIAAIKDLRRTPVRPDATFTSGGDHELQVHLRASEYAYFVHLSVQDESTRFSDNYFDLEPGESRTIVVANPRGTLAPASIALGWR